MPRPGRQFEELVARIERILATRGAVVRSPDRIRDLVTRRLREVDASITIQEGDATRMITIECRDHRKGRQDDRWIEQLVTKREKLGVWKTIAVSSSNFSESAVLTARHYGIELRRIDEITDSDITEQWAAGFKGTLLVRDCMIVGGLTIFDTEGLVVSKDDLEPHLAAALDYDICGTDFLRRRSDWEFFSAEDLARDAGPPRDLNDDGIPLTCTADFSFHDDDWFVQTRSGERTVSRILVALEYRIRRFPVRIESVRQYSTPEKPLLELVKGTVRVDNQLIRIESAVSLNIPLPEKKPPKARSKNIKEKDVRRRIKETIE